MSWSDGYVSRLKAPCSVNYPPINGYYVISDKMVIRSKLYIGFVLGHLYSSGSRPLRVNKTCSCINQFFIKQVILRQKNMNY